MKFCTKCGRQLEDGEECTCQSEKTAGEGQAATAEAAAPASKPIITKEQAAEISMGVLKYAKDFFKNPTAASEEVVGEHSLVTVGALVALNAVLQVLYTIIHLVVYTVKYKYSYNVGDWLKAIFGDIVWWIAIPAALAGLIWVCGKFIEKQNINFKKALSVFAIPAIPLLAFTLFDLLKLVLSHSFFGVVFGLLEAGIGGMMLCLTGIGIMKVIPKSDKFLYTIGCICAGLWFTDWLVRVVIF